MHRGLVAAIESRTLQVGEQYKLPVFYLLLLGAFAGWQAFFNIHLDQNGFSSPQIGILNAVFISTSALVVPFWGMFADRHGNNRVFFLLTTACSVLVLLIGRTEGFAWMLLFIALISLVHQPAGAVVDGMTMGFVRAHPRFSFGQFRLWSSAGYALASLAAGYLVRNSTLVIFYFSAVLFLLLSVFNLLTLPRKPVTNRNLVTFKSLGVFFRKRQTAYFLVIILVYGIAISPIMQFINLYYSDIGASSSFIGVVFFVQALPEIPAFLVAAKLVKRLGAERIILMSMAASTLRMFYYGMVNTPELAIIGSALHCITIAFFLVGVVEYIQQRTPDHLRTTGQALMWAFHLGAGVSLGNLLLGYLREGMGMQHAMLVHGALALLMLGLSYLFFRLPGRTGGSAP